MRGVVTKAWRFVLFCLLHTRGPLVAGGRRWSLQWAKGWRDCWPRGRTRGLQRKHKNGGYEGMAHSFRQPYFRRRLPDRLQGYSEHSLHPRLLFLSWPAYTRTHSISTRRSLRLQYPLFRFEDVRNNIDRVSGEMLLWFHFPDELGKRRGKWQDGRRCRKEEGAVNGWHMATNARSWLKMRLVKSTRTRQTEISGSGGKLAKIWYL